MCLPISRFPLKIWSTTTTLNYQHQVEEPVLFCYAYLVPFPSLPVYLKTALWYGLLIAQPIIHSVYRHTQVMHICANSVNSVQTLWWYSNSHLIGVNFMADAKTEHHIMKIDSI